MKFKRHLFDAKIAAYGLLWRLRGLKGGLWESNGHTKRGVYWINPNRIQSSIDHPGAEHLPPEHGWSKSPALESNLVVGGSWDLNTIPFEQMDAWQAFQQVFQGGVAWEKTDFYQRIIRAINAGNVVWDCRTESQFQQRLKDIERLFHEIKEKGFKSQQQLGRIATGSTKNADEISVHIGRDGDYIFADGRHRLSIAKLLALPSVPVRVCRRHKEWVAFTKEILEYARRNKGKLYAPILHPDLVDIPSHQEADRLPMIQKEVGTAGGRMLDIGSHWGYFCHNFENWGFDCTAVEYAPVNLHFMEKLKRAERRRFNIWAGSALDFQFERQFDVVLALNIFHHFIKSESGFHGLAKLLGRMQCKTLLFEPHLPSEEQMIGSFRNFDSDQFVSWVKEQGRFHSVRKIGVALDGRTIFALGR